MTKLKYNLLYLLSTCIISTSSQTTLAEQISSEQLLPYLENTALIDILNNNYDFEVNNQNYYKAKDILWNKFKQEATNLLSRLQEHNNMSLKFDNRTMRYGRSLRSNSSDNKPLYIALHGGGQTSSGVNDSQWEHMKIYYRDSVKQGTYVATRGITDNWNLHFEDESYPLYDKLIENMVVYDGIDPNRVYLTGFSAGGDGVYQITARMNDRFAATNMSAGHHNWINFENLYNTPMLIQMGEYDSAYSRNTVAAKNHLKLNELNTKYNGGYEHNIFLHLGGSHNSWQDNDSLERKYSVIANPKNWLDKNDRSSFKTNTNAITWLDQYTRNPLPRKIVWDLKTNAKLRQKSMGAEWLKYNQSSIKIASPVNLNYWLSASSNSQLDNNQPQKLIVSINKNNNIINIEEVDNIDNFEIYLHPDLLNLAENISIKINNQNIDYKVANYSTGSMLKSMLERTDPNWSFPDKITLKYSKNNNEWELV